MSEPGVDALLTVDRAIALIDAEPVHPSLIRVPLRDAQGYVLAAPLLADRDYPPFDKSLMDGFAVRSEDVRGETIDLELLGTLAAGQWPDTAVGAGQTLQIMTGAPMPSGADGVIPVEELVRKSDDGRRVTLRAVAQSTRYVSRCGSDVRQGHVILPADTFLQAAQLGAAASVGATSVSVFARPRVAVLGSGDEIVDLAETPGPAQIRNSNNVMLVALLKRLGCDVVDMGVVRDEPSAVRAALEKGVADHDVLFVTGGMSMGEFDYVPRTLVDMGATMRVTKLRIRPGKPFVFATVGSPAKYVFGLPGNPVSAFVCTLRLASRLVARIRGASPEPSWRLGTLATGLPANGAREFYQPARYDGSTVTPLAWKGSADVYTLASADALIVRPIEAPALSKGAVVRVLEIPR
jgi:molybdopterin molybdotransferase